MDPQRSKNWREALAWVACASDRICIPPSNWMIDRSKEFENLRPCPKTEQITNCSFRSLVRLALLFWIRKNFLKVTRLNSSLLNKMKKNAALSATVWIFSVKMASGLSHYLRSGKQNSSVLQRVDTSCAFDDCHFRSNKHFLPVNAKNCFLVY